jgi:hypothetical protein
MFIQYLTEYYWIKKCPHDEGIKENSRIKTNRLLQPLVKLPPYYPRQHHNASARLLLIKPLVNTPNTTTT